MRPHPTVWIDLESLSRLLLVEQILVFLLFWYWPTLLLVEQLSELLNVNLAIPILAKGVYNLSIFCFWDIFVNILIILVGSMLKCGYILTLYLQCFCLIWYHVKKKNKAFCWISKMKWRSHLIQVAQRLLLSLIRFNKNLFKVQWNSRIIQVAQNLLLFN